MKIPKMRCVLGALCSEKFVLDAYRKASRKMERENHPVVTRNAIQIQTDEGTFLVSVVIAKQDSK